MATHSSVLAWRIPGTEEPVGLPSMGTSLFPYGRLNYTDSRRASYNITLPPQRGVVGDCGFAPQTLAALCKRFTTKLISHQGFRPVPLLCIARCLRAVYIAAALRRELYFRRLLPTQSQILCCLI